MPSAKHDTIRCGPDAEDPVVTRGTGTVTNHVKKYLYGEDCPFWSSSYFIATTGSVSMETVKAYIDGQRTDTHKRKYEKMGRYKKSGSRRSRGNSSPGN
ncbi:transposase [Ruminococcus turbiniformis]|uniref:transposase n=1 Tax=Ruminococcus turbiniformis TaxID=2881258 RepID=UPI00389B0EFD